MKRKIVALVLVLCFFGAVFSCATMQAVKEKPFTEWSSKKQLTFAANVYATEYDKYVRAVVRTDLNDEEKDYLRAKRSALVGLDIVLTDFIRIVDAGGVISLEMEQLLLNQLGLFGIHLL